jgi:SAM-dependent methyltransferase
MYKAERLISPRFSRETPRLLNLSAQAEFELSSVIEKISGGAYVFEDRECQICNGNRFDILAEHDRYGIPIQTTICCECGLMQTNPDMREIDYKDFYTQHYRKLYIAELVGQPEEFFREEYWRGQRIVDYVLRYVKIPKNALILEIGCGAGGILYAFKQRGYRVVGTDLGVDNMSHGRSMGLDLRNGDLFDLELHENPALIIYSHVLEHICNPGKTLQKVRELLGASGHLYIEVPGVKDVHRNLFQGDFLRTFHLAHIYNFSLRTLTNLLKKNGFERLAGDETIRSIFRPGKTQVTFETDYHDACNYIIHTENWRGFYGWAFRRKNAVRNLFYRIRSVLINMLKRTGLYSLTKRLLS